MSWFGFRRRDQLFTEKDRLLALALHEWEADICPGCGHPKSESMDGRHDPADPAHVARYDVGLPWECLACRALHQAQNAMAKQNPDGMAAYQWSATLVPRKRPGIVVPDPA